MTVTVTAAQIAERCTITLVCASAASLPQYVDIVVDGKAYRGLWTAGTLYSFTYTLALERGPHIIYGYATDSVGGVCSVPFTYIMAYELTEYGIDIYSGDAKLDAFGITLHDALLPDLPTLSFSCATLLTGTINAVIRERGLRQYQFTIATVGLSNGLYQYTCKAAESYALTTALMALQTAYGVTSDAIKLIVPSLNIVNAELLAQTTYPQLFANITPVDVIKQLMIQALAQASVRNGNLYVFPLDVAGKKVTFSADIKSAVAGNVNFYTLGKYEGNASVACAATTTYQRFTMEGHFSYNPQGYNGDVCSLSFYGGYGSGVIPTVRNVEILVDGVQVLVSATEFTGSPSEYCMKDITAIAQQNMIPLGYRDPDYHMQRLDPLTGWQRDADIYDAVQAHYLVKQYPTPSTVLTLNDKVNWKDANGANVLVSDVTQVTDTLLPVPSGALGMLKSVGNASRVVSTMFKYFDRIQFNWLPVTAAYVDVSLQQDAYNKLDLRHTWAGQVGAGFILQGAPGVSTDTLTKDISCDDTGSGGTATKFVTTVTGTTTANCSYRVTLLNAGGGTIWQDKWRFTQGNTFEADVPTGDLAPIAQKYPAATVRIEFTGLYLIGSDYGIQCVTCYIRVRTWTNVGLSQQVISNAQFSVPMTWLWFNNSYFVPECATICLIPTLTENQSYSTVLVSSVAKWTINNTLQVDNNASQVGYVAPSENKLMWFPGWSYPSGNLTQPLPSNIIVNVIISESTTSYVWVSSYFMWSSPFNLFEAVDIPLNTMTRTGIPVTLQTIVLAFSGDNYVDSLCLVADNPLPVTVRAGTGSRVYVVTDDFGSEAGAQAYADGLLPIVSVAREQYTRDVSLATDLGVGDTVNGDGTNYTVYAVDYRQSGKTIAAGKAMDTLMTRLAEQSRQIDTLKRQVT